MGDQMDLKLGKKAARVDPRTIKMASLWKRTPPVPNRFDWDEAHSNLTIPTPMFANDELGCCVISGRAHQTLRFEALEQRTVIPITDNDVKAEYFKESGGQDSGLVILDSLKSWRSEGWKVGDATYTIHAFASVDWRSPQSVKIAAYYLTGCYSGVMLPESAKDEFSSGKVWSDLSCEPGGWGGHMMYICGYDPEGVMFVTWGKKQRATWEWVRKYCDEMYGIVDSRDKWVNSSLLDEEMLEWLLGMC
jgi:hypothetical protein